MENEETESNPWMVATIILLLVFIVLSINLQVPLFGGSDDQAEIKHLVKVAGDNGNKAIKLCVMESNKCTPYYKFPKMEDTGVCTDLSHPTCKLFKQLGLVK